MRRRLVVFDAEDFIESFAVGADEAVGPIRFNGKCVVVGQAVDGEGHSNGRFPRVAVPPVACFGLNRWVNLVQKMSKPPKVGWPSEAK